MTNQDVVTADVENGRIYLWTSFRKKETVKLIPGARWDRERSQWWLPLSWAACKQLRGIFGQDLAVGAALVEWAQAELADRIRPTLDLRLATSLDDDDNSPEARVIRSWRS